jgi:enediyne biosynthesis protein E4
MKIKFQWFSAGIFLATLGVGLGQAPIITQQPQCCTNCCHTTATLTVGATGKEPLAYQWQQAFDLYNYYDRPEGTNSTLVITNVQYVDSGYYRVIVTNVEGAIASEAAYLTVIAGPTNASVQPANSRTSLGASLTLRATASGTMPFAYQWRFNATPLAGRTNSTLSLINVQLADAGAYTAVVTNLAGGATSSVATVTVDPTFTKITTGPVVTDPGAWAVPSWWDYDNDGFHDLYVPNSQSAHDAICHNNGNGTFSPVTNAINKLLTDRFVGVVADYNNDGLEDLLTLSLSQVESLYRNDGNGNSTGLTASQVGFYSADIPLDAGWADYDRDGFIDLFVANGGSPNDNLYHNNGDGMFTRMTASQVGPLVAYNDVTSPCAWVDYDNDGYPDLWVGTGLSGTTGKQYLWHNNRDGTFSKVSAGSLANNLAKAIGRWADYDNDGYPDLFLTCSGGTSSLHRNVGGQTFTDVSLAAGVAKATEAWAAAWGDYENDGYLDLFVAAWNAADQSILYHNNGNGTFTSIDVGSPVHDGGGLHEGVAWADYDNDGFLDLLITTWSEGHTAKNLLYHNNGNSNAWLKVKLVGKASNRSAIGAKVRVQATIRGQTLRQMQEISGNSGISGGAGGLPAHFGLGDATNVDLVRIEWPSGIVQQLTNVSANKPLTVTEHQAEATTPPSLAAVRAATGKIQLIVTGQTNLLYVFEASTNLVQWTKIAVRTNLTGTLVYTPAASSGPRQFYRVLMP